MSKIKLKKQMKFSIGLALLLIIISVVVVKLYKEYRYRQTYEYKLIQIGYTLDETKTLINELNNQQLDETLTREYNIAIIHLVKEKYFLYHNLDRYLNYYANNKSLATSDIITLVNVRRDREFYEEPEKTDLSNELLMLVNKYHYLDQDYQPDNIIKTSASYSYANNFLKEEAYNAFVNLADDAKEQGYTIVIASSYRTYKYQENLWEEYKAAYGSKKADQYAARAGHSEHQSGYAIDVADFYDLNDKFGETESFQWMINNCYKHGFILRYPQDKEEITGYAYEPWHYRYVGVEIAEKIQQEKITFDEYYEFYLAK